MNTMALFMQGSTSSQLSHQPQTQLCSPAKVSTWALSHPLVMFYTYSSLFLSLQLIVFCSQTLKLIVYNSKELNSFKFSTSPQVSKCEILLAQLHFYQPRATGLVEMSNPVYGFKVPCNHCSFLRHVDRYHKTWLKPQSGSSNGAEGEWSKLIAKSNTSHPSK